MYDNLEYSSSAELCEKMAAECDSAILSFSTGKDSIASWLQMRKYFKRIIPYYTYYIPGLQFVEDSLKYYEDFFGCHIYRLPHPSFMRWLTQEIFVAPDRVNLYEIDYSIDLDTWTQEVIRDIIRELCDLPDAAYCGVGIRAADSLSRRTNIAVQGCINHNKKMFYPVYDWLKADMLKAFYESGVKLPVDYRMFGRTFDGLLHQYLAPLKEWFPDDYKKVLDWFPLAELEFARYGEPEKLRTRKEVYPDE